MILFWRKMYDARQFVTTSRHLHVCRSCSCNIYLVAFMGGCCFHVFTGAFSRWVHRFEEIWVPYNVLDSNVQMSVFGISQIWIDLEWSWILDELNGDNSPSFQKKMEFEFGRLGQGSSQECQATFIHNLWRKLFKFVGELWSHSANMKLRLGEVTKFGVEKSVFSVARSCLQHL